MHHDLASISSLWVLGVYAFSAWIGYGLVRLLSKSTNQIFLVSCSPGAAWAITASILFLQFVIYGKFDLAAAFWAHFILAIAVFSLLHFRQERIPLEVLTRKEGVGIVLFLALGIFVILPTLFVFPYGTGIDVWAIWKMKARFLYYDPMFFEHVTLQSLEFSHPDYPWFYPLMLIGGWLAAGREALAASWILSSGMALSCVGLLGAWFLRRGQGLVILAPLLLLGTPHWMHLATSQYADGFSAYFLLGAVLLFQMGFQKESRGDFVLAGLFLGTGVNLKDEGVLFLVCVYGSLSILTFLQREKNKRFLWLSSLAGGLPMLLLLVLFKSKTTFESHHLPLAHLGEAFREGWIMRGVAIAQLFYHEMVSGSAWMFGWIFIFSACTLMIRPLWKSSWKWVLGALMLIHAGYFVIYFITIYPLGALPRLLVQTYPLACLVAFEAIFLEKASSVRQTSH